MEADGNLLVVSKIKQWAPHGTTELTLLLLLLWHKPPTVAAPMQGSASPDQHPGRAVDASGPLSQMGILVPCHLVLCQLGLKEMCSVTWKQHVATGTGVKDTTEKPKAQQSSCWCLNSKLFAGFSCHVLDLVLPHTLFSVYLH